jgi:hypothetical protein
VCVGDYYKVGHYNGTGFFVKAHFEAEKAGRTVLWFSDDHWWITTITPTPAAEEAISWLAKGFRISPEEGDPLSAISNVHWYFPVKNVTQSNDFCRMSPSTQDEKLKKLQEQLDFAEWALEAKNAIILSLLNEARDLAGSPGASSSSTGLSNSALKTGWKNKMVAFLAAFRNSDIRRCKHLADV